MDPSFDSELVSEMLSAMGKELKVVRTRNKEIEDRAQSLKNRAEAAEHALDVMTRKFEVTSAENHRLNESIEGMKDRKVYIKKEVIEETPKPTYRDESTSTEQDTPVDPDPDHVHNLEEALEMYYSKYKLQKQEVKDLRKEHEELQLTLEKERRSKEKDNSVVNTEAGMSLDTWEQVMHTQNDIYDFMLRMPIPDTNFMREKKLDPVCLNNMDLKAYVAADPQLKDVAANLLCLPGRIAWCPTMENIHAIALGPMHLYNGSSEHSTWSDGSAFRGLYGRVLHLFYTTKDFVYYAGVYKTIDLRTQCPEGVSVAHQKGIVWLALAEASSGSQKSRELNSTLAKLYSEGALRVEPLGLQCISFDANVYNVLKNRFSMLQSAMKSVGKRGASYPELSMEKGERKLKKHKRG